MAWTTPHTWHGLKLSPGYNVQYLRFEGTDRDTGYVWYKTAPIGNTLLAARQATGMGGKRYQLHLFCGDQDVYDSVDAVINHHPDSQKDYKWTVKGPTWFNTSKLIQCDKVKEFVIECEKELSRRSYGKARLEVRLVEMECYGFLHCFLCLRQWGSDFEPERYIAVSDAQEELVVVRTPEWAGMLEIVKGAYHAANLPHVSELKGMPSGAACADHHPSNDTPSMDQTRV